MDLQLGLGLGLGTYGLDSVAPAVPLINYWDSSNETSYEVDGTSQTVAMNFGSDIDAVVNAGHCYWLDGVAQYGLVKYDGTQEAIVYWSYALKSWTYVLKANFVNHNDGTHDYHKITESFGFPFGVMSVPTTADMDYLNANPNSAIEYKLFGVSHPFSFAASAMAPAYFSLPHTYTVGSNPPIMRDTSVAPTDMNLAYETITYGDETSTVTMDGDSVIVDVTTAGTMNARPRIQLSHNSLTEGNYYEYAIQVVQISGNQTASLQQLTGAGVDTETFTYPGIYTFRFKAASSFYYSRMNMDGTQGPFKLKFTPLYMREISATEIYAGTSNSTTNLRDIPHGPVKLSFTVDATSNLIAFDPTIMRFDGGSNLDTHIDLSVVGPFWLEQRMDGVVYQHKYDGTNLTTYIDNVAGTPTAHMPESASYIDGKGVYPKLTSDSFAVYNTTPIRVAAGQAYNEYDQLARYTLLTGV